MTRGDDIADRLLRFSTEVLRVVGDLPRTQQGRHVGRQLVRSGTAGGAHYEEARGAESRMDFIHKVLIGAKEVGESVYWLRLIERSRLSQRDSLRDLIAEGVELVAILKASARTARQGHTRETTIGARERSRAKRSDFGRGNKKYQQEI